ncbi:MAG: LysR family transcriptional regulator [Rhodobacteraceae bacterium]|nr:LysR family transcriptional regulator [Paracoccaceae bacterium]
MARNLDLTALRALVAVADAGGVTRAAGLLNLTQSAVSMQIKRLEEGLGQTFFTRAQRKLTLTQEGELLAQYARKMLVLNDEALARLTGSDCRPEIRLGVPYDIVYPAIPRVLQQIAAIYPCARVNLVSSFTAMLKEGFEKGEFDLIVTTEEAPGEGGSVIGNLPLVWVGAPGGVAWHQRPLRLGFEESCRFRPIAIAALDRADIPWEMSFTGRSNETIQAMVAADLAVTVRMRGLLPEGTVEVRGQGELAPLGSMNICLYDAGVMRGAVTDCLKAEITEAYSTSATRITTLPVDLRSRRVDSASVALSSGKV